LTIRNPEKHSFVAFLKNKLELNTIFGTKEFGRTVEPFFDDEQILFMTATTYILVLLLV
jgi:hypothetical protein